METSMILEKQVRVNGGSRWHAGLADGFTLLELLIAVLLGSIVIAVVGGLFLANTNTFRAVDDASRLQENGRFALQTISRITRQAGYISPDFVQLLSTTQNQNDAYPSGLGGIANARFVAGRNGTGPNNSDELFVAFRAAPGGQIIDCSGTARTAPVATSAAALASTPIINRFYINTAASGVAAGNSLWCDVTVAGATTRFELISGVESFQVLYAIDAVVTTSSGGKTTSTRDFVPDYFTSANNLDGDKFNAALGIQVALVMRGAERSTLDKAPTSNTLNLFAGYTGTANSDATGAVYTIPTADQLRTFRVITSTINLFNRA